MFGRPSNGRVARNPGRRPIPSRFPISDSSRALFRQLVRNRGSDPRNEAYIIEIREGPAVNGNTNAAVGKSIPQPWVTVRDFTRPSRSAGLPVSVCESLLEHFLTCTANNKRVPHRDLEECASPDTNLHVTSPAEASGDATTNGVDHGDAQSATIIDTMADRKCFDLNLLKAIRIVCEATGCTLEVTAKDPSAKQRANDEHDKLVQPDPSRRWLVSAPLDGDRASDDTQSGRAYRQPWETCGYIELHEGLMSQLCAFLSDVVIRYRNLNQLPEVRSLYSASGGRRFFFDLRDTRWGKRLHISQVTDLHRNVIGVPLETLVGFRDRLDVIIQRLGLEDQHHLRAEIYAPTGGDTRGSSRGDGRRRPLRERFPRDGSQDGAVTSPEPAPSGGRAAAASASGRGRQRGRPRRYPPRSNDTDHSGEHAAPGSRRAGSGSAPDEGVGNSQQASGVGELRNRRSLRRNNYRSGYTSRGGQRPVHTKAYEGNTANGAAVEDCHEGDDVPTSTIAGSEGEHDSQQQLPTSEAEPVKQVEPDQTAVVAEASA